MSRTLVIQNWEESERGWGTRPDGYTVHLDLEAHKKYVEDHVTALRKRYGNVAPDEYTRTDGQPIVVNVSAEMYSKFQKDCDKRKVRWGKARWYESTLDLEKELFD